MGWRFLFKHSHFVYSTYFKRNKKTVLQRHEVIIRSVRSEAIKSCWAVTSHCLINKDRRDSWVTCWSDGSAPCVHHIHQCTPILFLVFSFHLSVSNYLFSCKNKSMNNGWDGKWQKSEAILSLLIKLSAWRPLGITKAWNCLTFFSLHSLPLAISQWGGQQDPLKVILEKCKDLSSSVLRTDVQDIEQYTNMAVKDPKLLKCVIQWLQVNIWK